MLFNCLSIGAPVEHFLIAKYENLTISSSFSTQVLFFGFGWLFFMRQLFKDYEVQKRLLGRVCCLLAQS